jgi:hypothetical protein
METQVEDAWGEEEKEKDLPEVTMQAFEAKIQELAKLRTDKEELEAQISAKHKEIENINQWLISYMNEFSKTSYKSCFGRITVRNEFTVKTPKSPEDREAFREYLSPEEFNGMWSINHRTLNAWNKKELEKAHEMGHADFYVPGLGAPTHRQILAFSAK